jgi:hypothetical protein
MPSTWTTSELTEMPCPGRDCYAKLNLVTKRLISGRDLEYYECPDGDQHVTQQWEPPSP